MPKTTVAELLAALSVQDRRRYVGSVWINGEPELLLDGSDPDSDPGKPGHPVTCRRRCCSLPH